MTRIADAVRITSKGKVKSVRALAEIVAQPVGDHIAPCTDMLTTCVDLECQVRKGIRQHLLENVSQEQRPKASESALMRLNTLLNDGSHGAEGPDFFVEASIAAIAENAHVQAPRVVVTPIKAVRIPRIAKHQPRTTDNQEHIVTTKITMTKDQMERAISAAVDARIAERERVIRSITPTPPADKPVEIVRNAKQGGRSKIQRATAADREFAGLVLPAIVLSDTLTIPALEVGQESIDTVVTPKVRSPYNKARYRLDKEPAPLDTETTTYRVLMAEHKRIAALVSAAPVAKTATKTTKPVAEPAVETVAVAVVVDTDAKAVRKAKIKALMTVMGISKDEAKALVG